MQLVLILLARRLIRLARADVIRADMLMTDAEGAYARAQERIRQADAIARRAGFDKCEAMLP